VPHLRPYISVETDSLCHPAVYLHNHKAVNAVKPLEHLEATGKVHVLCKTWCFVPLPWWTSKRVKGM